MKLRARRVNNYDLYANHAWYVPGIKGILALLGMFLLGSLIAGIIVGVFAFFLPQEIVTQYSTLVAYPLSFIPPMIYAATKSQRNSLFETGYKLTSSNFGPFKVWQIVLITVALTAGVMLACDYPNYLNYKLTTSSPAMKAFYDWVVEALSSMTGGPLWSSFLLAAVFAPVFEEWLCRGMVLRGLLTKMRPAWAIVLSALFFAVIHMNPWQALVAFIIGLVMGYVYYKTGCLWLTMLMHFVNNATAVSLAQFTSVSDTEYWIEVIPRETYILQSIVGVILLAAGLWAFHRIPLQQERGNIDEIPAE